MTELVNGSVHAGTCFKKKIRNNIPEGRTYKAAFHSTKDFGTNGAEIYLESFRKMRKFLNFRNANRHSTEIVLHARSSVEHFGLHGCLHVYFDLGLLEVVTKQTKRKRQ